MVAGFSDSSNNVVHPALRLSALCSVESDFLNLIHQADITVNGQSTEQCQLFINVSRHFQLISEMSVSDVATRGHTLGFAPTLDTPESARYQSSYAAVNKGSGNGYSNDRIFGSSDNQTSIAYLPKAKHAFGNSAGQHKIGRYIDLSNNTASGIYGASGLMIGAHLDGWAEGWMDGWVDGWV